jgi:hypothetical protein
MNAHIVVGLDADDTAAAATVEVVAGEFVAEGFRTQWGNQWVQGRVFFGPEH